MPFRKKNPGFLKVAESLQTPKWFKYLQEPQILFEDFPCLNKLTKFWDFQEPSETMLLAQYNAELLL